jgi:hypothetical protein
MESRVLHENHILQQVPRKVDNVERMELKWMPSNPRNNSVYIVATVTEKHQHVVFSFFFL